MFEPKIAKAPAKGTEASANGITKQNEKPSDVEQVGMPQWPPGRLWDLSKIPIFQHGREDRLSSPTGATQARGPSKRRVDGVGDQLIRMPGEPLEAEVRREAERRFRHDSGMFASSVAERRPRRPQRSARWLSLWVGTLLRRTGQSTPGPLEGHATLFHELTHIVQQAAFDDHDLAGAPVLDPAHPAEQEARAGLPRPQHWQRRRSSERLPKSPSQRNRWRST